MIAWRNRPGVSPLSQSDLTGFTPPPSFGPFRVLHQIGTGVLGPVFRTYEPARDRLVAVKAFRLDITPEQARELADELQRVGDAGLDHPSIVSILGAGTEGSLAYSASEYVAAESLDIALRHYAPAGLTLVLPFITQLAGAIDFARAAGIGHGALHPRDIFVTPEEARATGFGVVQALETIGVRAPVRRPYTAPERVDGGTWDVTADVYSLGAIAFELMTGRRPVGPGIDSLGSTTGPHGDELARVISRALDDDPARRYPAALAFAAALEAASRGEPTTAAIEEVRAVAGGAMASPERAEEEAPAPPVHELTVEPEPADLNAERDADLADFQFREAEAPAREREAEPVTPAVTLVRSDREEVSNAEPPGEVPPGPRAPEAHAESWHERRGAPSRPAPMPGRDLGLDRSLFEEDRESEDRIPEVLHAGFEPDLLEPGYQSEPPPPEGWDPGVPLSAQSAGAGPEPGDASEREVEIAPAAARVPQYRSVVLPVAITLLLGLFVGFLAGYLVFVRDGNGTAVTAPTPGAGAAQPDRPPAEVQPKVHAPAGAPERSTRTATPPPASPAPRSSAPSSPSAASRTPPATATAPARGRLVVRSTPSGAQVFVNGRRRGTTPLALRDLAPGTYTIRVAREGYTDASERVSLRGSSVREVSMRLARSAPPAFTGSLFVDSRPRGARVVLDGKDVGTTPLQLGEVRAGAHVVRLELTDHRTWTASARVVAGQVVRVTGSLERLR